MCLTITCQVLSLTLFYPSRYQFSMELQLIFIKFVNSQLTPPHSSSTAHTILTNGYHNQFQKDEMPPPPKPMPKNATSAEASIDCSNSNSTTDNSSSINLEDLLSAGLITQDQSGALQTAFDPINTKSTES